MNCVEIQELVHGYLDDELAFPQALQIDHHLAACETCQHTYAQAHTLRSAIREQATYYSAPAPLRRRVLSAVRTSARQPAPGTLTVAWWNFGAALACAVLLTWSLTVYLMLPPETAHLPDEIVASHIRSLLASHVTDVLSSDQHTVKPWFNGKLDFSPPVKDLTTQGFLLVGGRLDYINGRSVAALVYRHRQHIINLFVWPAVALAKESLPTLLSLQGYNVLHWTGSGMTFWAISDLNQDELKQFQVLLQAEDKPKTIPDFP
jgi:anti-sigma factor RsiW